MKAKCGGCHERNFILLPRGNNTRRDSSNLTSYLIGVNKLYLESCFQGFFLTILKIIWPNKGCGL